MPAAGGATGNAAGSSAGSSAGAEPGVRLPAAFLARALDGAAPDSPVTVLAVDRAGTLPAGPERDALLAALLTGPHAGSAPEGLLAAAVGAETDAPVLAALAHPDCPEEWHAAVAARRADERLGALAHAGAHPASRAAVVAELRRRVPAPAPVTPEAVERPDAARLVLRSPDLAPEVLAAAVALLPGPPAQLTEGQELNAWVAAHGAALSAWRALWREVLTTHADRVTALWALLSRDADAPAGGQASGRTGERAGEQAREQTGEQTRAVVAELLLGTLPHALPAALLVELAEADLARFAGAALTSRVCRLRVEGHAPEEAAARVAEELAALPEPDRRLPSAYLGTFGATPERGLAAATDWIARALAERWRPLLEPDTDHRLPWRSPPETRAALRARYAEAALAALALWRPRPGFPVCQPGQLAWLAELARLLPADQRPALAERAGALLADAREGRAHRRRRRGAYPAAEDPAFDRALHATRRALGLDRRERPADAPLDELSWQPAAVLDALAGPGATDGTLERLLLAHAVRGYPLGPAFDSLLARHSAPADALHRLTGQLRTLLGPHPGAAGAWTEAVTVSPHRTRATLRALPAHLALAAPPPPPDEAGALPTVLSLVTEALAARPAAWHHFATGPLRDRPLGEALDRALARPAGR
ncbi:hypothetical protein SAMN06297387_106201 [Streptomyces zhaozhouensis]|uniref:Uncharacterized protein n=1 Tax=Streptomyces zhaozhouensis TaxID=1300267 RepID=A0A286DVM8_9ACTN|nr:hypothetical protein [Streptomyces zhaozhouensis]SOD62624.1 hypothetical protein SAMN06297387_106201 [Streptomyces zhaozhouensis]